MELLKDIAVNLFSDAIWALGGFMVAHMILQKNQLGIIVPYNETIKKIPVSKFKMY
ncbi:hypothetical protein B0I18_1195 [Taibaiella chishuiensis]|uniref:Uncharacterized protein n=1 Tax=Taibaiella chishuiensis TaxID=1434707 RepID=A0A2P8CPJ5_9BACT|nr:hypothetical protein B0I18_1195 [Taibaiella chishuiensis]